MAAFDDSDDRRARAACSPSLQRCIDNISTATSEGTIIVDPAIVVSYATDWTGEFGPQRSAVARSAVASTVVARPDSPQAVAEIVRQSRRHGCSITPQGGNTGLVGGSVPSSDDTVILSTTRLTSCGAVDRATGQITVGSGVTLAQLSRHLRGSGWRYAVDFAARETATIGGSIATNAGGFAVFRHGSTRHQVLSLEYVTSEGEIVSHLDGVLKNNTGYALDQLLCGSEGTLGIICAARLKLIPECRFRVTATVGFTDDTAALEAAWALKRSLPDAEAIEFISSSCRTLVGFSFNLSDPLGEHPSLLVEVASNEDPSELIADAVGALDDVTEVIVATSTAQRDLLWRFRDDITAALPTVGNVSKFDVSVPHSAVISFMEELETGLAGQFPESTLWLFGHACDDNLHVNVTTPATCEATGKITPQRRDRSVEAFVYGIVAAVGGSISAEHGIGRLKREYLHLCRSPAEIAAMSAIRQSLDPAGLFNPGVIFTV